MESTSVVFDRLVDNLKIDDSVSETSLVSDSYLFDTIYTSTPPGNTYPISSSALQHNPDTYHTTPFDSTDSFAEQDEDIQRLNRLTAYYKQFIQELPPLSQTAAALISNASNTAAANSAGMVFQYDKVITCEKPAREPKVFNPRFNSSARRQVLQNQENAHLHNSVNTVGAGKSWMDYIPRHPQLHSTAHRHVLENEENAKLHHSVNTVGSGKSWMDYIPRHPQPNSTTRRYVLENEENAKLHSSASSGPELGKSWMNYIHRRSQLHSTAHEHLLENEENAKLYNSASTIESAESWTNYISKPPQFKEVSKRCDKSLQTMLTMDSVGKISEILNNSTINNNITNETVESAQNVETFRLSERRLALSKRQKECDQNNDGQEQISSLSDCDLNVKLLTDSVRARVVNWIVKIDDYLGGNLIALQCAVYFLDELSSMNNRRLPDAALTCGAACLWIATKLHTSMTPGASVMARHSRGAFSKQDLVYCERKVLAILAFPSAPLLAVDETERIADCWSGTAEHELIVEGANYVCCCGLLHARLTRQVSATELAEGALAVSARALAPDHPINTYLKITRESSQHDCWQVQGELERMCRAVSSPACVCREPYLRYSARRRHSVALRLSAALVGSPTHRQ